MCESILLDAVTHEWSGSSAVQAAAQQVEMKTGLPLHAWITSGQHKCKTQYLDIVTMHFLNPVGLTTLRNYKVMVLTDNTEAYDHSIAPSGTGATTDSDSRAENVPPRQHLWVGPEGIKDERRAPFSNVSYLASQPRPAGFGFRNRKMDPQKLGDRNLSGP